MMQVKPLKIDEIKAVEYECECGSMGRLTIDVQDKSLTCDVFTPDLKIRVMMKEDGPDMEEPRNIDDVLIIEEL
ncbi:MAG: hypothetical protein OXI24_20135 [Candidatus Poribacteria bacterium]|nr:hypothetical protein [Candidatus Poribacteria bacterium]